MESITFNGAILYIGNNKVTFDFEILEVEKMNNNYLVLLKIPSGSNELDNLYSISLKGDIIWRIKEPKGDLIGKIRTPYIGISLTKSGASVVDFYGRRFYFNESNGEVLSKDIVK